MGHLPTGTPLRYLLCHLQLGHQAAKHSQVKKFKIFLLFIDDSITRVTIFWRNQLMKPPAVAAILGTGVTILAIILLTQFGRYFSQNLK